MSNIYRVTVEERLARTYIIKADSPEEAEKFIETKYETGAIVLGGDDFADSSVNADTESGADESECDFIIEDGKAVAK